MSETGFNDILFWLLVVLAFMSMGYALWVRC